MPIDPEKLAKLQKSSAKKVGGSRIKAKKVNKSSEADDSKLQEALKKLNAQTLDGVEEANFFKNDGSILHFNRVGVQSAAQNNTFAFTGYAQEKKIVDLLPGILPQLGSETLNLLTNLADSYQKNGGMPTDLDAAAAAAGAEGDDEVPDLVEGETFENEVE